MSNEETAVVSPASFKRDVLTLASGTVVGQVLTVLTSPILARLFAPDAFGIFALVAALVFILTSISSLQYQFAVMLPERDDDAANLFAGALVILLAFSLLLFPVLWLLGPWLADWLNAPSILPYLWLIPLIVLFGGLGSGHSILEAWAARKGRFAGISISKAAGSITTSLAKLAAGFAGFVSGGGLLVGSMSGSILAPILLARRVWREDMQFFREHIRLHKIGRSLRRYQKFAVYNTPSALLSILSNQSPQFLLAIFFSPAVVGYYAFGYQLLYIPMNLIGASVSQAFYPHATAASRKKELATFVEMTFRRLIEYSLFPSLMLMIVGRDLFSVVFGPQWAEAGVYAQVLSLWLLFWFISIPLSQLINVLEKNEAYFRWNLATLLTRVASIWLGARLGSPLLALALFSVSGACIYAYISYWVSLKAGVPWTRVGSMLLRNLAIFAPAGGAVLLSKLVSLHEVMIVALAVSLTGLYFIYRVKDESIFRSLITEVGSFLRK